MTNKRAAIALLAVTLSASPSVPTAQVCYWYSARQARHNLKYEHVSPAVQAAGGKTIRYTERTVSAGECRAPQAFQDYRLVFRTRKGER